MLDTGQQYTSDFEKSTLICPQTLWAMLRFKRSKGRMEASALLLLNLHDENYYD